MSNFVVPLCAFLIAAKWAVQVWLGRLNQKHVHAHAQEIPEPFRGWVDEATYAKSVEYTLAKSRFHLVELTWDALLLAGVLFSGILPWVHGLFERAYGAGILSNTGFLIAVGLGLSLAGLPLGWYAQFRLEQRFGFNTTTQRLWWLDHLKGLLLGLLLGGPMLVLILKLVESLGMGWWLWAWACVVLFQLVLMVAAPVVILPLFNKFSPLPQGALRDRLLALADRTEFRAKDIQVMDGSKRSRHSNAFFTGLGRLRKIVLFDTLVEQLEAVELEGVLAHEIGHYKKRHIPKMILWSMASLFAGFWLISVLGRQEWFYRAFGFAPGGMAPAFLLFALLAGLVTFWFSPVAAWWSRKHEFEADAYAAGALNQIEPLLNALRKLNEKNLSNLTPHPWYSAIYYSHPTLLEREQALRASRPH